MGVILFLSIIACRNEPPNIVKKERVLSTEESIELNRKLIDESQLKIKSYIRQNQLDMTRTGTGLWYGILDQGEGNNCEPGDLVRLKYRIHLLDGTPCYNSDTDGLKTFEVGHGGVEQGLEEGILLLNEGSRALFIMPHSMAYGLTGDNNKIPGGAILLYEVTVMSVN